MFNSKIISTKLYNMLTLYELYLFSLPVGIIPMGIPKGSIWFILVKSDPCDFFTSPLITSPRVPSPPNTSNLRSKQN